tara:strand:+ start:334 stop:780 length:447 start_codon:yes stop_codon:yes gene_type:complete
MIKFIEEKDIDDVLNLGKEFHNESSIFNVYKWDENKSRNFISKIIKNKDKCGILAYNGDELVGMILGSIQTFYFSNEKSLDEYFIYIKKEKRGTKLVFKLLTEWVEWGKQFNVSDVWLKSTTGIKSKKTNKLFERLGFKQVGSMFRRR